MELNNAELEKVVNIATDNGASDCRIGELRKYLDTIIDSCKLGYRGALEIDGEVLTTILKIYSISSVNEKMKELKAEEEEKLNALIEKASVEREEDKDAE